MAGFTITATNHTSFTVSSLDRAIGLFQGALGFTLLNRSPRDPKFIEQVVGVDGADIEVAYLQAPGHRLELIEYRGPADRGRVDSRPCDAGFAHIAFDVDDIHEAIAAVRDAGSEPLGDPITVNAGPNKGGPRGLHARSRRHHGRVHPAAEGLGAGCSTRPRATITACRTTPSSPAWCRARSAGSPRSMRPAGSTSRPSATSTPAATTRRR